MEPNETSSAKKRVLLALAGKYPESEAARQASRHLLDEVERMFREIGSSLPGWLEVSRDQDRLRVGGAVIAIRKRSGRIGVFPYDGFMSDPFPQPVLYFNASTGRWVVPETDDPDQPQSPVEAVVEILLPGMVEGANYYRAEARASGEPPPATRVPQFSRGKASPGATKENPMKRSRPSTLGCLKEVIEGAKEIKSKGGRRGASQPPATDR